MPSDTKRRSFVRWLAGGALCGVAGLFLWLQSHEADFVDLKEASRTRFGAAEELHRIGKIQQAVERATDAWKLDKSNEDALRAAVSWNMQRGETSAALGLLQEIPVAGTSAAIWFWRGELLERVYFDIAGALTSYSRALAVQPVAIHGAMEQVHGTRAQLLAKIGRRQEAIPDVLTLLRSGIETDLLILLARSDGGLHDREYLQRAAATHPDAVEPQLGLAWILASQGESAAALKLLTPLRETFPNDVHVLSLWCDQVLTLGDIERLERELFPTVHHRDDPIDVNHQRALAAVAESRGDLDAALSHYALAWQVNPESISVMTALTRLLAQTGDTATAEVVEARLLKSQQLKTAFDRLLFGDEQVELADVLPVIDQLAAVGRLWEALGWSRAGLRLAPDAAELLERLRIYEQLTRDLPLLQTAPQFVISLDHIKQPTTQFAHTTTVENNPERHTDSGARDLRFEAHGAEIGFDFRYDTGVQGTPTNRMFEFTGGGIGVLDFDCDGWPDLFCTQGGHIPTADPQSGPMDALFRNLNGQSFQNCSQLAGLLETGFGQGVAIGDFNSDGFPDIYVANLFSNELWMNLGDGTFSPVAQIAGLQGESWTTSCLLADLNGDGHPDLYDVNYLAGENLFDRVCRQPDGSAAMCMPFDFDAAVDQLWLSDGKGRFIAATEQLGAVPLGKGLGIAAWVAGKSRRLSLLVANDTTPNFFFQPDPKTETLFIERGMQSGMALNQDGKAEGCMGIAVGDYNSDGQLDVHITNFLAESNTLYEAVGEGFYTDATRSQDLQGPTLDLLGFGTQFLDADQDGVLELFVANGHIQDLTRTGRPYRMSPQLFQQTPADLRRGVNFSGKWQQSEASSLGSYFKHQWLGRSVARVDWNNDQRDDLLIGHLYDPSILLTNRTPDVGNTLTLRCVGVDGNREAIGTIVRVTYSDREVVAQLTAGDGYQASNQRILQFGCGTAEHIDALRIEWSSGHVQELGPLKLPARWLLIEGKPPLPLKR